MRRDLIAAGQQGLRGNPRSLRRARARQRPLPGCLFLPFPPHHAWPSRICQESSGNNQVSTGGLFCGVSVGQWGQAASLQAGSSAEPSGPS